MEGGDIFTRCGKYWMGFNNDGVLEGIYGETRMSLWEEIGFGNVSGKEKVRHLDKARVGHNWADTGMNWDLKRIRRLERLMAIPSSDASV